MSPPTPVAKRRLKLVLRFAMLALVAWFVHRAVLSGWQKLEERIAAGEWSLSRLRWAWLIGAVTLYSLAQLPCGLFFHQILDRLGQRVSLAATIRAFYIGHLGKYVPGKAMVVVMRSVMLAQAGAHAGLAAVAVFYETLTMMAVGAIMSTIIIAFCYPQHSQWLLGAAAMIGITGLPTFPPVFAQIMKRMKIGRGPTADDGANDDDARANEVARRIHFGTMLRGWALNTIAWIVMGMSIWATVRAAGFASDRGLWAELTVGTVAAALSVVIGFLSFIPGGFGVRDGVLFAVLTWNYDEATAMVTAILVRLVWLVAELLVSVILYKSAAGPGLDELRRRQSSTASGPPP